MNIFKLYESVMNEGSIKASLKYYPELEEGYLKYLAEFDPTYSKEKSDRTGKYTKWIWNVVRRIKKKDGDVYRDDLEEVEDNLKFLEANKRVLKDFNIDGIKTFNELKEKIEEFKDSEDIQTFPEQKASENYQVFMKAEDLGLNIIFDDDDFVIGVPETYESSKVFGDYIGPRKISKWCTTQHHHYNLYTNGGPLFIIMDKKTGDLYQYHKSSESFRDENNDEGIYPYELFDGTDVDFGEIVNSYGS